MKQAEAWLKPLSGDDGPCGPDLEYDNAFLDLIKAAEGKPETQFEKGAPPDWLAFLQRQPRPTATARTWLLAIGWRRHGLLVPTEVPGS